MEVKFNIKEWERNSPQDKAYKLIDAVFLLHYSKVITNEQAAEISTNVFQKLIKDYDNLNMKIGGKTMPYIKEKEKERTDDEYDEGEPNNG